MLRLGPGDFFGELALLVDDGARVARVKMPTRPLHLDPRDDFLALVETEPSFALHMLRELARRLAEARRGIAEPAGPRAAPSRAVSGTKLITDESPCAARLPPARPDRGRPPADRDRGQVTP